MKNPLWRSQNEITRQSEKSGTKIDIPEQLLWAAR